MKFIRLLIPLVLFFSIQTQAARDSVGVFYSTEKVNVLINERGMNQRLHQFMDAMGWAENHYWENEAGTLKIHCAREDAKGVCVFTLKPSEHVVFKGKSAEAHFVENSFSAVPYEMTFESSMQDKFLIKVQGSEVYIWAGKKGTEAPF